jgi:hypothetical protein
MKTMNAPSQLAQSVPSVCSSVRVRPAVFSRNTDRHATTPPKPLLEPLITRKELCAVLRVHHDTVRRWELSGKLMPVSLTGQTVRYRLADAQQLLTEARQRRTKKTGPKPKAASPAQPTTNNSTPCPSLSGTR